MLSSNNKSRPSTTSPSLFNEKNERIEEQKLEEENRKRKTRTRGRKFTRNLLNFS
jgi:hypothetical protein